MLDIGHDLGQHACQQWQKFVEEYIQSKREHQLLREPRILHPTGDPLKTEQLNCGTRSNLLLFSTNDYLGLSSHPDVRRAAASAASTIGMGVRSAAIVSGHSTVHERLERELAALKHTEASLLFPSGFAANLAAITALASSNQVDIFSDELNHASLIDGCRLARSRGAGLHVYRHCDYAHLSLLLQGSGRDKRKLVVTDGVFSMDGDSADIQALAALKKQHGFLLLVDDAHGTLVLGPHGGGVADAAGLCDAVDVHVGTLSKAVGAQGGFIACRRKVKQVLVNAGRSYMFSTALPLPIVAAALAALHVFHREKWRVVHLQRLQALVRERLNQEVHSPIVPIVIGDAGRAVAAADALLAHGCHVPAIRPPTVPVGSSRLRLTLSAEHQVADVLAVMNLVRRNSGSSKL